MSFNSLEFIFFASLFLILWNILHSIKLRWYLLSFFSLFFYAWGGPEASICLIVSVLVDYWCGKKVIESTRKKYWLALSLTTNLGMLTYFKYLHKGTFPIGLSFYTFQSLSYTIDLYRGQNVRAKSFVHFMAYVSMFPQLVAGPICRAKDLLNQLNVRSQNYRYDDALLLISQGYFKKAFLADHFALLIDPIFLNKIQYLSFFNAWALLMAYGWQIYWDFSGYTDIARGLAKLMGLDLPINFNRPYLADSLKTFWHRWHISLSTWFRDYVYISLGGSRHGLMMMLFSIMMTMLLSGIWHGGTFNFVLWGIFHAIVLIIEKVLKIDRLSSGSKFNILNQLRTYFIVTLGWAFFRISDFEQIKLMITKVIFFSTNTYKHLHSFNSIYILILMSIVCELLIFEKAKRYKLCVTTLFIIIVVFFRASPQSFIYYRF